jgi:predicted O-methyltransferase YrrM
MDFIDSDSDDNDENTPNLKDLSNSELLKLRPKACGVLSFHNGIEEMMFLYIIKNSDKNNPISIIKSIDEYCYSKHWMMHIGNQKSKYLVNAVEEISNKKNELIVEIGCYCGYSALIIAMNLSTNGHLICIDISSRCIEWTRKLLEYAGLLNKVSLILIKSIDNELIQKIHEISNSLIDIDNDNDDSLLCKEFNKIDMLFIDHGIIIYSLLISIINYFF